MEKYLLVGVRGEIKRLVVGFTKDNWSMLCKDCTNYFNINLEDSENKRLIDSGISMGKCGTKDCGNEAINYLGLSDVEVLGIKNNKV